MACSSESAQGLVAGETWRCVHRLHGPAEQSSQGILPGLQGGERRAGFCTCAGCVIGKPQHGSSTARAGCHRRCSIPAVHGPAVVPQPKLASSELWVPSGWLRPVNSIGFYLRVKSAAKTPCSCRPSGCFPTFVLPTPCSTPRPNQAATSGQCQDARPPFDCCSGAAPVLACCPPRRRHSLDPGSQTAPPAPDRQQLALTHGPSRTRDCTRRKNVSPNSMERRTHR